eukprot:gnl/Spiro4/24578_TR12195_c0_g1_i1.p2 gnl/Spiro4/24578_TR12195_c0_g1~~gnl/Spiro4/24578_TR12195_c0_g1_i1.p2  ORF type:complete len:118 (+),score=32.84 gnl/Spiro4/24578_TR12195_c0_g1_i1:75-428(+)
MGEEVGRILAATTLYERLAVHTSCTTSDIKRRFNKLVLLIHPDKNPDPRAKEAFQAVHEALETLGNAESRRAYNTTLALEDDTPLPNRHFVPPRAASTLQLVICGDSQFCSVVASSH